MRATSLCSHRYGIVTASTPGTDPCGSPARAGPGPRTVSMFRTDFEAEAGQQIELGAGSLRSAWVAAAGCVRPRVPPICQRSRAASIA